MTDDILARIAQIMDPADLIHPALDDLNQRARPPRSDYDLNGHLPVDRPDPATLKPAAVLVAFIDDPDVEGLLVLLTQRAAHLSRHAGQVAFPGGRVDPGDDGPVEAALREAHEEVGLPPERVQILGLLEPYETVTGYYVVPVLGLVDGAFTPEIDPNEVEAAFEVPATFLLDPANHERHSRTVQGIERHFYAIPFGDRYIWGATAAMVVALSRRLYEL